MKIKLLNFIIGALVSINAHAAVVLDVYGTDETKAEKIIQKYQQSLSNLSIALRKKRINVINGTKDLQFASKIEEKNKLMAEIANEYGFLYVNFATVYYPDKPDLYTTLEVVEKNAPERLYFLEKKKQNAVTESSIVHPKDLIEAMLAYLSELDQVGLDTPITNDEFCPAYHCLSGFEHPRLQKYLSVFDIGMISEQQFIIDTLANDPDDNRRAAAVFLMGHHYNPSFIIKELLPYTVDPNPTVRNNAMRVVASTIVKAKIYNVDPSPFIHLLDSVYETDRNKALAILAELIKNPASKTQIANQALPLLINNLRLKQPNNHNYAYYILKKIAMNDFGEFNSSGWQAWNASRIS